MKFNKLCVIFFFIIFAAGCTAEQADLPKHQAIKYNNQLIEIEKDIKSLDISMSSGNIELYCWGKKEIKYEAKNIVSDKLSDDELQKLLEKFSISSEQKNSTLYLKINFEGKNDDPEDKLTDLKLTLPKTIKSLHINQSFGSLKIKDRYTGNISADLNCVSTEIDDIAGKINVDCKKGNFRINKGKLHSDSTINIDTGNIIVKAECEDNSRYSFTTGSGNIELKFPVSSAITLDSFGVLKNNQFTGIDGDISVEASTKIGEISVNGY